jgi:hypothetical protein
MAKSLHTMPWGMRVEKVLGAHKLPEELAEIKGTGNECF